MLHPLIRRLKDVVKQLDAFSLVDLAVFPITKGLRQVLWINLRIIRHLGVLSIMSMWSPSVMRCCETNDTGRLLEAEAFLSMICLMIRRSVRTTAVPGPSLRLYMPPYCFAHSVNLC